jgi:HEAT repeat protein
MKDARLVLLFAVPLVLVVGGIVLYELLRTSRNAIPERPDRPEVRSGIPPGGTGARVDSGSFASGPGPETAETSALPPSTYRTGITDPILTVERAKMLMERGTWEDWAEIETLLRVGQIPDPLGLEALFLAMLAKGGNGATFLDRILPALSDPEARAKAVEDLLVLARESVEPNALKAALSLLGKMATEDSVEELGRLAHQMERQEFFTPAVYAIAKVGGAKAAAELDRLLAERVGSDTEHIVLKAIGMAGSPEMIAALAAHLSPEEPAELRMAAIRAMGLTGRPEAIEFLKPLVSSDSPAEVSEAAILSLSRVGGKEAVEELLRLRKEGGALGEQAGLALGNVTGADAAKPLVEALPAEESDQVKVQIIDALGKIGSPEAFPTLREMLSAEATTSTVRGRSARALCGMGDVEALDPVLLHLGPGFDSERVLQVQMVEAIEALTVHAQARPALFEKAVPVLKALAERAPKNDALHYFTIRALNRLEAARPREPK